MENAPGVLRRFPIPKEKWENKRLIEGVAAGDPIAGNEFFDRFGDIVARRVRYLLGGRETIEDVVQKVFVELIDSIHAVRHPEALRGWVNRVSTFVVSKELRREIRGRWLSFVEEPPDRPAPAGQHKELLAPRVRAVLACMRNTDRIVFVMRFVEESEISEIAEAFNWSITTSRRRIQRAREVFLKKAMRDPLLAAYRESYDSE
mgnify:CR=1 FL=1